MKLRILFFLLFSAILNYSKAQIITTIAGNGYVGDGGPATSAPLKSAWNVAKDAAGNIYVADAGHNRIRKINANNGIITTFAGNGISAYSGDGGLAVNASINGPTDVFVSPSGNIYIAEVGSYVIRKVTVSTGIITTVAGTGVQGYTGDGGSATSARLGSPWRLCVDKDENIYYTDLDNNVVRKIDANSGIISTIAGDGTFGSGGDGGLATGAQFGDGQNAICVDASKNIYIADFSNRKIRKIDALSGIINTIAGGGGNNADNILATNASLGSSVRSVCFDGENNLYIGTTKNCRKVNAVTGIITTVVGKLSSTIGFSGDGGLATEAQTWAAGGEFVDSAGNIYVSDHVNCRVRKVDVTTGIINTIAGNGNQGMYAGENSLAVNATLAGPLSVSVDKSSNLIIADYQNNRIRKINSTTGIITTIAGNGLSGNAADGSVGIETSIQVNNLKTDKSGNIYFSGDNRLRKLDANTGIINIVAGNGDFTYSGDGGLATQAGMQFGDFCLDTAGNIYLTGNYRVRRIDAATGLISTISGTGVAADGSYSGDGEPASSATFGEPTTICTDDSNNIYILDYSFGVIRKIAAATGIISTIAGSGSLSAASAGDEGSATAASFFMPGTIATDNLGDLFIMDGYSIRKITKSTGIISTVAGIGIQGYSGDGGDPLKAKLSLSSFALNKTGTILYIADGVNDRIRKVSFNTTTLCPPSWSKTLTSNLTGSSYQWQINNGTGFTNISDNANYTGTSTGTVHLNNIPGSYAGYELRCLVDGNYSESFTLKFLDQWTGAVNTAWENAANWSCSGVPDANTDVVINAGSTIVVNSNVTVRSLQVSPGANIIITPGNNLTVLH